MNAKEKITYMNQLLEIYGSLLTSTQRKIMSDRYQYDLSLQEISEHFYISRSAALDAINVASKKLMEYERKLHFLSKKEKVLKLIKNKKLADQIKTII